MYYALNNKGEKVYIENSLKEEQYTCPVCGGLTEVREQNDVQSLYCVNAECPVKQVKAP